MEVDNAVQKNIPAEIETQNSAAVESETAEDQAGMNSSVLPVPKSDNAPTAVPTASENLVVDDSSGMHNIRRPS